MKFKVGDKVRAIKSIDSNERVDNYIKEGEICEVIGVASEYKYYPINIKCGDREVYCREDEIELVEENSAEQLQAHKGCEFVNDDFYRVFTKKNGQVIFNKVKVSTVCICKDDDDIDSVIIAKIDSDKRLEPNTKVRLSDGSDGTVLKSIKIMNKYLDDLVQSLVVANVDIVDSVLDIVGIYKEQEVTKTELVLEEI